MWPRPTDFTNTMFLKLFLDFLEKIEQPVTQFLCWHRHIVVLEDEQTCEFCFKVFLADI